MDFVFVHEAEDDDGDVGEVEGWCRYCEDGVNLQLLAHVWWSREVACTVWTLPRAIKLRQQQNTTTSQTEYRGVCVYLLIFFSVLSLKSARNSESGRDARRTG